MKWLDDMRVSMKILMIAVIAAAALFFVGYTGYSKLQDSNDRMGVMYNQKVKNMQLVSELKYWFNHKICGMNNPYV